MQAKTIDYEDSIKYIIESIKLGNFDLAKKTTFELIENEDEWACGHNVLGAIYEVSGNFNLAMKHYRASCDLDPTFLPALKNISRLCQYPVRFGLEYILFN